MAKRNNWHEQHFLALINIGANYHQLSEYGEALHHYLEAYTVAIKELEPKNEMSALNNIAVLYSEEKKYEEAEDFFKRAYMLAKKNGDSLRTGIYAINLGNIGTETNRPEIARSYFVQAERLLAEKPELLPSARLGFANCYFAEGKSKLARETALQLLQNGKQLKFDHIDIKLLVIISRSYLKDGMPELALDAAQQALARKPDIESKMEIFKLVSEIYTGQKAFENALHYKDSLFDASVRLNDIKNGKLYANSKIKFELLEYKNRAALNEARLSSQQNQFYLFLTLGSILLLFVIWFFRNRSLKSEQRKIIAERNEQKLVAELEKEKNATLMLEKQMNQDKVDAMLEQQRLKNEVELKNRKLSAKALYLSGKNQMIEEIVQNLTKSPEVLQNTQVVAHIQSLKEQLKQDNEWDSFVTHFEEIDQGFLHMLRTTHPDLTVNDIRYLCYIYMDLSTKEIASMLHISPDSCRKRKERILIKLGLAKTDNLRDYLSTL